MTLAKLIPILFSFFVLLIGCQPLFAQEDKAQIPKFYLGLSYGTSYSIGDFFVGLVALRATNFSESTNKKILKALIKGRDSRVKSALSTDQYKVYKARAKERRTNLREFMKQNS